MTFTKPKERTVPDWAITTALTLNEGLNNINRHSRIYIASDATHFEVSVGDVRTIPGKTLWMTRTAQEGYLRSLLVKAAAVAMSLG